MERERKKLSRGALFRIFEWFGNQVAIGFLEKNFDAALGFFKLRLAHAGEPDAFFEQLQGFVERKLRAFEFADDFFEAIEGALEVGFFYGNWFRFFCSGLVQVCSSG
jgi:hypothetical protein